MFDSDQSIYLLPPRPYTASYYLPLYFYCLLPFLPDGAIQESLNIKMLRMRNVKRIMLIRKCCQPVNIYRTLLISAINYLLHHFKLSLNKIHTERILGDSYTVRTLHRIRHCIYSSIK